VLSTSHWDVLVTDYEMPAKSGLSLLHQRDPHLPAILISAQASDSVISEVRSLNAAWLQKPFSASQLITKVDDAAGPDRQAATISSSKS
jgi:DNA-binding NtrC family response regulator